MWRGKRKRREEDIGVATERSWSEGKARMKEVVRNRCGLVRRKTRPRRADNWGGVGYVEKYTSSRVV